MWVQSFKPKVVWWYYSGFDGIWLILLMFVVKFRDSPLVDFFLAILQKCSFLNSTRWLLTMLLRVQASLFNWERAWASKNKKLSEIVGYMESVKQERLHKRYLQIFPTSAPEMLCFRLILEMSMPFNPYKPFQFEAIIFL